MKYILIIVAFLFFQSCKEKDKPQSLEEKQKEIETGSLSAASVYTADEIGWTVHVPAGWEILTKEQMKQNTAKGKKVMEESTAIEIDASDLQQLLNLRKDKFNSFLSTMEKYDIQEMGSYEKNSKTLNDLMKQAFEKQGIHADYSEDTAMIDGLRFTVFKSKMYGTDKKQVILNLVMYNRLINGYDVGMTITYNNEGTRNELEKMIIASKFSKRN